MWGVTVPKESRRWICSYFLAFKCLSMNITFQFQHYKREKLPGLLFLIQILYCKSSDFHIYSTRRRRKKKKKSISKAKEAIKIVLYCMCLTHGSLNWSLICYIKTWCQEALFQKTAEICLPCFVSGFPTSEILCFK